MRSRMWPFWGPTSRRDPSAEAEANVGSTHRSWALSAPLPVDFLPRARTTYVTCREKEGRSSRLLRERSDSQGLVSVDAAPL